MTDEIKARVTAALLKSLYRQNFISEDIYHHCLDDLSKAADFGGNPVYDTAKNHTGSVKT